MQYNRKWILNEMRSGKTILDIGVDINRGRPSIGHVPNKLVNKNSIEFQYYFYRN